LGEDTGFKVFGVDNDEIFDTSFCLPPASDPCCCCCCCCCTPTGICICFCFCILDDNKEDGFVEAMCFTVFGLDDEKVLVTSFCLSQVSRPSCCCCCCFATPVLFPAVISFFAPAFVFIFVFVIVFVFALLTRLSSETGFAAGACRVVVTAMVPFGIAVASSAATDAGTRTPGSPFPSRRRFFGGPSVSSSSLMSVLASTSMNNEPPLLSSVSTVTAAVLE